MVQSKPVFEVNPITNNSFDDNFEISDTMNLSKKSFSKVWNNKEDDIYAKFYKDV